MWSADVMGRFRAHKTNCSYSIKAICCKMTNSNLIFLKDKLDLDCSLTKCYVEIHFFGTKLNRLPLFIPSTSKLYKNIFVRIIFYQNWFLKTRLLPVICATKKTKARSSWDSLIFSDKSKNPTEGAVIWTAIHLERTLRECQSNADLFT